MKLIRFSLTIIAVLVTGCDIQTGVAPTETVIAKSSDRDFGFTGIWLLVPKTEPPYGVDSLQLEIHRDANYDVTISNGTGKNEANLKANFRTHEISPEHPHAIVEIEIKNNGAIPYRRLAIAAVRDDNLYLWMIDGRKLSEPLFKDGASAVIEHFAFSTTVRCEPQSLLDSIARHSDVVIGDVQVFRRRPDLGK